MAAPKRLNRDTVERLKPTSDRREVADASCPGLRVVVQPSGAKSWALRYVIGGRTRKLTLGSYPAVSLENARTAAAMARDAIHQGRDPAIEKMVKRAPANTILASLKAYDQDHLSWGREYRDHETGEVTPAKTERPEASRPRGVL